MDSKAAYIGTVMKALMLLRAAPVRTLAFSMNALNPVLTGLTLRRSDPDPVKEPWLRQRQAQNRIKGLRTHSSSTSSSSSDPSSLLSSGSMILSRFGKSGKPKKCMPLSVRVGFRRFRLALDESRRRCGSGTDGTDGDRPARLDE